MNGFLQIYTDMYWSDKRINNRVQCNLIYLLCYPLQSVGVIHTQKKTFDNLFVRIANVLVALHYIFSNVMHLTLFGNLFKTIYLHVATHLNRYISSLKRFAS